MIRIATEADVPQILAIYAPYVLTTTYTFEYTVPTEEEFLRRFRAITEKFPWLVWEEEGRILGYAYGSAPFERAAYSWCAEDSVYLHPDAQGRGIGTRLCRALEKLLAYQGYRQIYAIITSENQTSLAFHKKLGYTPCGHFPRCGFKFGRWLEVTWLFLELPQPAFHGDFPTSWTAIMEDDKNFTNILDILSIS